MSWTNQKTVAERRGTSRAPCAHGRRQRRNGHHVRMVGEGIAKQRHLRFECLEARRLLSLTPIISEVEAANGTGILDAAGAASDWLEVYNPDPTTAVNLAGWSLNYQKTGSQNSTTWTIPSTSNVVLGPGEFRVIFCDSTSATDPVLELHTNFNLSKAGATVELINASSAVVSTLTYPALSSDTSYGPAETVSETDLVAAGATATYYAPTSNALGTTWTQPGFNDSAWSSGPTGLGYANTVPGFAATLDRSNLTSTIGNLATATTVINTPSEQTSVVSKTEGVLDFEDSSKVGHFTNFETAFPGMTIGEDLSNIVMQATGTLQISASQAGYYTFGVNSDDGFSLTITGASFSNPGGSGTVCSGATMKFDGGRGAADSLGTTYLAAGSYPLNLLYFQGVGGDSVEFYAAKESTSAGVTSFDANSILVGATTATTASGGTSTTTTPLVVTSAPFTGTASGSEFATAVATNVKSTVQSAIATAGGTSLYTRISFAAANYASLSSLTLKMQYDDGYVAYLNGVEVASANAPSSPTWNSLANEEQTSDIQATTYENVNLSAFLNSATTGHLTATGNVLAIQVLLSTFSTTTPDGDMLVVPELAQMTSVVGGDHIFSAPTPAAANTLGNVQPDITFSTTHGLFYAPVQVTLTPDISGDSIYYTTDNTAPAQAISSITYSGTTATVTTEDSVDFDTGDYVQIANATPAVYDGTFPITVSTTYTSADEISTFTYTLPSTPTAVATNVAGTSMIATRGTLYTGTITVNTTTDLQAVAVDTAGNVGSIQCETYVFPVAVASQPATPAGFPTTWVGTVNGESVAADYAMSPVPGYTAQQVENALSSLPTMSLVTSDTSMFGPLGLYSNSNNHTLEYPASFEYLNPLSGTTAFGSLVGLSMYGGVGREPQYLKHEFQISFDQDDGVSALNENIFGDGYMADGLVLRAGFNDGWSWGGANTQFIIDQWTRNALTALGTQNSPGIWVQLFVNGQYWGMYNACAHISSAYAAYFFGGQKSDYDVYHYSSDGFNCISGTMTAWTDMFNVARYGNAAGTGTKSATVLANPTAYALMAQYLNLPSFCDYIITNYYGANWDWDWHNYSALVNPTAGTGLVFQDWDGEGNLLNAGDGSVSTNITNRDTTNDPTELFVQLLANPDFRQMFADHVAKDLNGVLSPTSAAAIYQSLANTVGQGVIDESARWGNLGELDGTWASLGTPATWTNQLNKELGTWFPQRTAIMFTQFATAVTFSSHNEGGSPTYTMYPSFGPPSLFINGTASSGGAINPGDSLTMTASTGTIYYTTDGSDPRSGGTDFTISSLTLSGTVATCVLSGVNTGLYIGESIEIGGAAQTAYDGTFPITGITVNSSAGTTAITCTVSGSPASPATPLAGQSLIAATLSTGGVGTTATPYSGAITLAQGETINARVYSGSTWSALNSSVFYVNLAPSIRITEMMYAPAAATAAEIAAGYTSVNGAEDFEFVELQNIGTTTAPLAGLAFTNGVSFTFPSVSLAAGAYIVVCSDPAAFAIRYGSSILSSEYGASWLTQAGYSGHFNNAGEDVTLATSNGGIVQDFTYSSSWYPQTDGGGFSLVARSTAQKLSAWGSSSGWEPSGTPGGTPGAAETVAIPLPDSIVVNEVLSNPSAVPGDMIEFCNTTSQPINIGGWFVSNSSANLMEYQIASGTVIAANGYYVLTQDSNFGPLATGDPGRLVAFSLNPDGDNVYLSNVWAPTDQPGGYREHQSIDAMPVGCSYGLYAKSTGGTDFTLLETPTFGTLSGSTYSGGANSIPYVSPLVTDQIMYAPSSATAAEVADGYTADDFEYVNLYNPSSSPVSLANYYVGGGIGYTPGWLADGLPNEFETLESGAAATWSASSVASASYTVYAHLNLYDGDNNLLTDLDSAAQYAVTIGGVPTTVVVDQTQVPAALSVTNLAYSNASGLVTASANNSLLANNALAAGSIVHIAGATPSQYDGTFVVQSATSTTFTYTLASGLNLAAATGTITAGLNDVWISLGTYTMSGAVSVQLTRTTAAKPSEWTVAGGMDLVNQTSQQATVLSTPTFSSYSIQHPVATLAAGSYAVLVSNYAAFEERYNPTGTANILVLGVYSGHLNNGGDTVDIDQIGNRESGSVTAANGYVPFYRVDHVNYQNSSPWPTRPDGDGPALMRIHAADYGNDQADWWASNVGGTPGQANMELDNSAPSIPANVAAQALLSPTAEVNLTWSASSEPRSYVADYVIDRNGLQLGTSTTTSFADTTAVAGKTYTYSVSAVNRDGYASAPSTSIIARPAGRRRLRLAGHPGRRDLLQRAADLGQRDRARPLRHEQRPHVHRRGPLPRRHEGDPHHEPGRQRRNRVHDHHDQPGHGLGRSPARQPAAGRYLPVADGGYSPPGLGRSGRQRRGQRSDQSGPQSKLSEQSHVYDLLDFLRRPLQHGRVRLRRSDPGIRSSTRHGQLRFLDRQR